MSATEDTWQENRELQNKIAYVLENNLLYDCYFEVGTKGNTEIIAAHRLIMTISSSKFEEMFEKEQEQDTFRVIDVEPTTFKKMIEFIYTGKVELTTFDSARSLSLAAFKYLMRKLMDICVDRIIDILSPDIFLIALELAIEIKNARLEEICLEIIANDMSTLLNSNQFDILKPHVLECIYDCNFLNIKSELELYNASLKWAHLECIRRDLRETNESLRSVALPLLRKVRFLTLTAKEVFTYLENSPVLLKEELWDILAAIVLPEREVVTIVANDFTTNRQPRNPSTATSNPFCIIEKHEYENENNYIKEITFKVSKTVTIVGVEVCSMNSSETCKNKDSGNNLGCFNSSQTKSSTSNLFSNNFVSQQSQYSTNSIFSNCHSNLSNLPNAPYGNQNSAFSFQPSTCFNLTTGKYEQKFVFKLPTDPSNQSESLNPTNSNPITSQIVTENQSSKSDKTDVLSADHHLLGNFETPQECIANSLSYTPEYVFCIELYEKMSRKNLVSEHLYMGKSVTSQKIFFTGDVLNQRREYCFKVLYSFGPRQGNARQANETFNNVTPKSPANDTQNVFGKAVKKSFFKDMYVKNILYR